MSEFWIEFLGSPNVLSQEFLPMVKEFKIDRFFTLGPGYIVRGSLASDRASEFLSHLMASRSVKAFWIELEALCY